jgi:hypothetical protein
VILGVFFPAIQRHVSGRVPVVGRLTSWVSRMFAERLRASSSGEMFVLGLLNGLLPCGFVYLALAAAATAGDTVGAVLFMSGFGVGTIPVMLSIALLGKSIRVEMRRRLSAALPVVAFVLGVLFIVRGLNLGIPFVSPKVEEKKGGAQNVRWHDP